MKLRITVAIALLTPVVMFAQVRPTSPVSVPGALVKKTLPSANITAIAGTAVMPVSSYKGVQCADKCIVATGGIDGKSGVSVHFADGSVHVEEVRTALVVSHDKPHSLTLSLDRSEILGMQCNERGDMKASPNFRPLGATSTGYKWVVFQGAKMLKTGHSNGEAVEWNGDGHNAGSMQLAVFSDVTIEISHGDTRLVMTSDDGPSIEARTGGTLKFNELGIQVAGVPEFAVTSARIQGVNK